MNKVTVVICCYNEVKFVEKCLGNLQEIKEKTYPDLQIVVKDQNSTDGSKELIRDKFPWVRLIEGKNDGLSKGYNIAYRETDTEYLLFLGMDAFPEPDVIPGILQYFEKNVNVGAATCELVLRDGSLDLDAHRAFPTPWVAFTRLFGISSLFPKSRIFNKYFLPGEDMTAPHEIDMCISHFMFARRKVLDQIGGFDEDFFLYGEDVDVCYRIKQAGWKIMYLPQWRTVHLKGGSVGIRKTTRHLVKKPLALRLRMHKLSAQAMEIFVRKHFMEKYPKIVVYSLIIASYLLGEIRVLMESFR